MTSNEFVDWQRINSNSNYRWEEERTFALEKCGVFFYKGGENGIFIFISEDGVLRIGTYQNAVPHIMEAMVSIKTERPCGSFYEAFRMACEVGGIKFLMELFGVDHLPQSVGTVEPGNQTQGSAMKM